MAHRYRYPLSFQTILPDDYSQNEGFVSLLELLRELGFWGVELNISDPPNFNFEAVRGYLGQFDLELSMLATGLTACRLGLSLSHPDEAVRKRSVEKCQEMIGWVKNPQTGIIIGFLKGGPSADVEAARRQFARSLAEIMPVAEAQKVPILIEATNRYESAVANTIEETVGLISAYGSDYAQVLPDTFHMNIEETDMLEILRRNIDRVRSLHFSDNNRHYPGFGAINFRKIVTFLGKIGYKGRVAIEGNVRNDVMSDLRVAMKYLAPQLEG
jgi:sugar phosphate isomerase/epimerase